MCNQKLAMCCVEGGATIGMEAKSDGNGTEKNRKFLTNRKYLVPFTVNLKLGSNAITIFTVQFVEVLDLSKISTSLDITSKPLKMHNCFWVFGIMLI